jgi:hypothetical protein
MLDEVAAARELLRRNRARSTIEDYAQAIDVPGRPVSEDSDEWMFSPIESPIAQHHRLICRAMQQCMTQRYGRLMIFAPPGSAKSSYASVVAPTWYLGKHAQHRIILTSYASGIAGKQSRRARQICRSEDFHRLFGATLPREQSAVDDWALSNGSQFMAAGILAGITGNRAEGLIIDDPVAGREEADSETMRKKTLDAYQEDLLSRLLPGGWCVLMMTRWHQNDLAGCILPEDYAGQSGLVRCRDGMLWNVLRIPAQCDRADDPLGRAIGDYLWPEWFDAEHWRMVQETKTPSAMRAWGALYQQNPTPDSGTLFKRECVQWYDPEDLPKNLRRYLASDFATGTDEGDYTEHGVVGVDENLHLWGLDWFAAQKPTNVTIAAALDLIRAHRPTTWFGEKGVIEKAFLDQRRRLRLTQTAADHRRQGRTLRSLPWTVGRRPCAPATPCRMGDALGGSACGLPGWQVR